MAMPVKAKPDGYHTATPYLIVDDASGLVEFMKAAFGATERFLQGEPGGPIQHGEVQIGDSVIMFGSSSEKYPALTASVHLYIDDVDAVYKQAIAAGATSVGEPADQRYGDRSAGVLDAYGTRWWLATHIKDVPPDEM
jgi:uncharacterized glyoxalase superfamily protein PhnB